ncbi:MAG: VanZ family protein [Bacteroidota bacterium]
MKKAVAIFKYQIPSVLWAVFIFVLCTSSTGGFSSVKLLGFIPTDKLGHAFIFSALVYFLILGFVKYWRFPFMINKIRLLSFILAIAYGLFIELYQLYVVVGRTADYWDFIADVVGAALGILMFHSVYGNLKFLEEN